MWLGARCGKVGCFMSDLKCASALLAAAHRDLRALQVMRDPAEVDDEVFGLHVQQAAEKTIKAWIAFGGREYPLTHDIDLLLDLLAETVDVEPHRPLARFTPFGVQFRYTAMDAGWRIEREAALTQVRQLYDCAVAAVGAEPP